MLNGSPSVLVVTASIGSPALRRCVESVQGQTFSQIRHLIVIDGAEYAAATDDSLDGIARTSQLSVMVLPRSTGHSGHFGYRIYGAIPLLSDEDVVCYLDEDNWFDAGHVETCVDTLLRTGASWAYALRRICSEDAVPLCDDDCDSLGYWPKYATMLPPGWITSDESVRHAAYPNLVDSSCYALTRKLACALAPLWQARHADSVVASYLVNSSTGACTGRSTVSYALGGGSGTPVEWFTDGNRQIRDLYCSTQFPWRRVSQSIGP